jgi:anti-sigma B factor antagonist
VVAEVHALPDPIAARVDAGPPPFAFSCTDRGLDAAWVNLAGELDIATTPQLVRTLREAQLRAHLVVLDLRKLMFMDCTGVHAIVNASIRARRVGRRLILMRGPPNVDRLFALTGTSDQVEVGDVGLVEPHALTLQRSMVSLSLLRSGGKAGRRMTAH